MVQDRWCLSQGWQGYRVILTGHHTFDVTLGVHAVLLCEVQDQLLCRLKLLGSHQPPEGLGEYPSEIKRKSINVSDSEEH